VFLVDRSSKDQSSDGNLSVKDRTVKYMNTLFKAKKPLTGCITWLLIIVMLISGGAACASATSVPSQLVAVSECESNKVSVTGVHWFKDSGGAWRVEGVINNNSSKAISKVVTGVETYTKTGQPADQGEDVSAYPLNLQPGDKAPFTAWIDREIPGLDSFKVEVDECVLADPAERGKVEVHASRMAIDNAGIAQVTAELFNPGPKPVLINGLMAAVYDRVGNLIAGDNVRVATRSLAPGESGPVRAALDLPPNSASQISSYKFFMDAVVNTPNKLPLSASENVKIIRHYTDQSGQFHLVGQITNPGPKGLMTSLEATVYSDSSKSVVVDAAYMKTWIPLLPGESLPFDLVGWGALNNTSGLWDQLANQNATISVRLEPFLTWTEDANVASLKLLNENEIVSAGQAIFKGEVQNNLAGSIDNGFVTVVIHQKNGGEIVATGSTPLAVSDSAAPGQVMDYSIIIPLPGNVDLTTLTSEVSATGQLP
jgi:hypothetical protein